MVRLLGYKCSACKKRFWRDPYVVRMAGDEEDSEFYFCGKCGGVLDDMERSFNEVMERNGKAL